LEGDDINRVVAGAEFHRKTRIEHNVLSVETTIRTLVPEIPSSEAKAAEKSLADINSPRIYLHAPPSYLRAQGITTAAVLPQVPNLAAALVGADPNGDIDQLEKPQDQEVNALIDAGNRALNNREYERAIVELDKALQLNPKAAMALADRGMAYQWKGDIDRAKADFDAAFEIDPRNEVVPRGRGVLAMREWHYAEAIEEFTKSLDLHVDSVFTLTRRAEAYKASGDLEHAIADAEAAVRLDPLSVHPLVFLAEIQFDHNDLEGALATLNKAIAIKGETSELLIRRGIDHTRLHHQELAQKDIGAARAAASSAGALNDVCWSLASSGVELEMALEACDAALALKRDGSILDSRGFALLRMGRYDDAITSYDQSLELRPTQPESLYGRGLAKRLKGDTAGSDRDMKLAVVFDRQVGKTFEGYGLKP
ncbi:MAG: tetratricopeptide repeat protein, partial [Steroidobacteraceae bacterium]